VVKSVTLAVVLVTVAVTLAGCGGGTPANCTYTVQLAQHPGPGVFAGAGVPAAGGSYSVDVLVSPSSCPVPTQTADSWVTIAQEVPDRGLAYRITAAPNTGTRRTGTAYVGYQALTVDQAGTAGSGCTFQIVPAASSYSSTGGTGAFVIVPSDARCGWDAERSASGEDWSTEPRPNRGIGTMGIVFSVRAVGPNQPPVPRTAQITIRDSAAATAGTHQYSQQ
jgi:hypothetical protein